MNKLVFNIETIPDIEGGRRLHDLQGLTDKEVANVMFHKQRQENGSEFLSLHLHRVVAISVVLKTLDQFSVYSLGDENAAEKEIVEQFFSSIEKNVPTMISWNGQSFDLPVLHYRALVHGIQSPRYWETGDNEYHGQHIDLMELLAGYNLDAGAPLDEIATLLGFPGKRMMKRATTWNTYRAGDLIGIRDYCETSVLNTYLVYLRFELINGNLSTEKYAAECEIVRSTLAAENKPHLNNFLAAWQG